MTATGTRAHPGPHQPHGHPVAHRRMVHAVHVVIEVAVLALLAVVIYAGAQYEKGWDRRTDATVCRLAKQC